VRNAGLRETTCGRRKRRYSNYNGPVANIISLTRILLLIPVVWLIYLPPNPWQFASVFVIIVIFLSDIFDGYLARRQGTASQFGALFDITADRIVEFTLWIVAADVDLVPVWVPLVFVFRGTIVDTIRAEASHTKGVAPFAAMHTAWGKRLVAGRFMRGFYGTVKAFAFCTLVAIMPLSTQLPELWAVIGGFWTGLTYFCVYLAVVLCILRGLPVLVEFGYRVAQKAE